jgi:adenosylhomocysteine nucleosidase
LGPAPLPLRWSAVGRLGDTDILLAANGPGRRNALRALEEACQHSPVGAIVSTGFVGALDPKLRVGDVFLARSVLEFSGQLEYSVELPECVAAAASGRLVTVDSVVQDAAGKARLRATGADAVDMEAAAVAHGAQARRLPFYCIRAVSDDAQTSFELDFNQARRSDGTFSGWRIAAQAGLGGRRWRQLMDLRRAGQQAACNLAAFFERCSFKF